MQEIQPNNPLHGVTLEQLLNELVSFYGWDALGRKIEIRCFTHDPSITSSLKFLRRTRGHESAWNRCMSKWYNAGNKQKPELGELQVKYGASAPVFL